MSEINALGDTLQRQRTVHCAAAQRDGPPSTSVFASDMDERLVLVNPAGERLLGRTAAELLGAR